MTSFIGTLAGGEQTQWKTEYGEDIVLLVEGGEWALGVMAISRETNEVRSKLRQELKRFKERLSLPMLHVTHDLKEAIFLGDNILSIVKGRISESWFQRQVELLAEDDSGGI